MYKYNIYQVALLIKNVSKLIIHTRLNRTVTGIQSIGPDNARPWLLFHYYIKYEVYAGLS